MAALQLLAIAGYCASLRLALHPHKHTLHPVQLIFLGSRQLKIATATHHHDTCAKKHTQQRGRIHIGVFDIDCDINPAPD
jgi:hypothetical protein